jgi:hypothetical protein
MPGSAEIALTVRIDHDGTSVQRHVPAIRPEAEQLLGPDAHPHPGTLRAINQIVVSSVDGREQSPELEQATSGATEQRAVDRVRIGEPGPHP